MKRLDFALIATAACGHSASHPNLSDASVIHDGSPDDAGACVASVGPTHVTAQLCTDGMTSSLCLADAQTMIIADGY
jgi:hypothetical protein